MKIAVEINTENAILAQNLANKLKAFADKFATPQDLDRFLAASPQFLENMLVKQALKQGNIKLKTQNES